MSTATKSPTINGKPIHTSAPARTHAHSKDLPAAVTGSLESVQQSAGNLAIQQLLNAGKIRAKLTISQPNDPDEQEADAVADRIMRMPDASAKPPCPTCAIGATPCPTCAEGQSNAIHRKASGDSGNHTGASVDHIRGRLGSGHPLDKSTRAFFEPRLGTDLSHVRLHTDRAAAESAKSIQAKAYTFGSNIVFGTGEHAPQGHDGRRLFAHELVHTVQQSGRPDNPQVHPALTQPSDSAGRVARQSIDTSQSFPASATTDTSEVVRHVLGSGKGSEVVKLDDTALATTNPTQRAGLVKILTDQWWTSKADEQVTMKLIRLKGEHTLVLARLDVLGYREKLLNSVDDDALHKELEGLLGAAPTLGTGPVADALASRKPQDVQRIPYSDLKTTNKQQRIALLQIMLDLWNSNAAEEGRILDILESSGTDLVSVMTDVKALGLKQRLFDHIDEEGSKQRLTTLLKSLRDSELDADLIVFNRSFFGNVAEGIKKGASSAVENFSIGKLVMGMLQPIIHPIDTVSKHIDDAMQVIKMPSVDGVISLLRDIFGTLGMWLLVAAGVVALVGLAVSAGVITLPAGIAIEGLATALVGYAAWCGIVFVVLTIIKLLLDTGEAGAATTAQEHKTESEEIGEGFTALVVIAVLAGILKGLGKIVKGLRGAAEDPAKADPDALKKQAADAKDSQSKATDEANKLKDAADKKQSGSSESKPEFKKGAYEAADPAKTPREWEFVDEVSQEGDLKIAETKFKAPSPKEGMPRPEGIGKRALNTKTGELEMVEIKVPREAGWIETESPVVEGKGTRTAAYVTMRLMRMLGIAAGSLKSVVIRNIYNLRAVLELRQLEARGVPRDQAVLETNSVTSQETALTQSGHKISGAKVTPGKWATLKELLDYWETKDGTLKEPDPNIVKQHDKILNDFGLSREQATTQKFFWDYDIEVSLKVAESGAATPKSPSLPSVIPVLPKADYEEEEGK